MMTYLKPKRDSVDFHNKFFNFSLYIRTIFLHIHAQLQDYETMDNYHCIFAKSAGAEEYTDCFSAEG